MTAATDTHAVARGRGQPRPTDDVIGVSQRRVVVSELIKLRTLRSSWYTMAAAVGGMIGISALVCWAADNRWSHMAPIEQLTFDPVFHSLVGVNLAQLAVAVLGVLFVTGEYGTGMIRATLGAVPTRLPVVWAKLAVFTVVALVATMIASFISFEVGQALLGPHGTTLGAHDVLRAVLGAGLYLTVVAAMATGMGFAVRNTAGGIAAIFGLLLVLPGIAHALPTSWQHWVLPYLPSQAGGSVYSVTRDTDTAGMLSAWVGFAVFCAWAAASVVLGAVALVRKDA